MFKAELDIKGVSLNSIICGSKSSFQNIMQKHKKKTLKLASIILI